MSENGTKPKGPKRISYEDWSAEGIRLFGKDAKKWEFVCPNCGHVQTIEHFIQLGIEDSEKKVFYSCIGRWTGGEGTMFDNTKSPCNYTSGGLFKLAPLIITTDADGKEIPTYCFAFNYKREAREGKK